MRCQWFCAARAITIDISWRRTGIQRNRANGASARCNRRSLPAVPAPNRPKSNQDEARDSQEVSPSLPCISVEESRISVEESRISVEESRISVEESRISVEESRISVEESCDDGNEFEFDEGDMQQAIVGSYTGMVQSNREDVRITLEQTGASSVRSGLRGVAWHTTRAPSAPTLRLLTTALQFSQIYEC